ncbi:MAG: hypothetical protein JST75_00270 [Bacteroidetes bacterium]|nr:hypothetical protein [Bacteroidota bacterium]
MKKTILALAVMLTTGLTSAFANKGEEVNKSALTSFHRDFLSAKNVSWQQQKDYAKATFSLNDHVMFAYYNDQGELLAVVRNILSDKLPIRLLTEIKNDYSNYWISELFEMATEDQTTYYVTIENGDERIILKSQGLDQWSVYKKEKKNCIVL